MQIISQISFIIINIIIKTKTKKIHINNIKHYIAKKSRKKGKPTLIKSTIKTTNKKIKNLIKTKTKPQP